MKRIITIMCLVLMSCYVAVGQGVGAEEAGSQVVRYVDAAGLPVFGKASGATRGRYERLPAELEGVCRAPVWYLGTNSAGVYVRFSSNSTQIRARWTSTYGNHMDHMADVGTRGLDLYVLTDTGWKFVGAGRPSIKVAGTQGDQNGATGGQNDAAGGQNGTTGGQNGATGGQNGTAGGQNGAAGVLTDAALIQNMTPQEREYMLYLSLYDGVSSLEIGVDEGALIEGPKVNTLRDSRKVVMYGTSILQGGCASRPGMVHTSILGRMLEREVINLGFSGNALLDLEIARLMAGIKDPAIFILDYVPNAYDYLIREKGEAFFRIIRDAHPEVPVLFIDDVFFAHYGFDQAITKEIDDKNAAQKELFEKLKKSGEKNIYYISRKKTVGTDNEPFVDGIHFTDLGMMRYAEFLAPRVKKIMLK